MELAGHSNGWCAVGRDPVLRLIAVPNEGKFLHPRPGEAYDARYRVQSEFHGSFRLKEIGWQRRDAMKDLVKQYLDNRISRRQLLSGLGTLGITAAAANSMAQSLAPFFPAAEDGTEASVASRILKGTGGALLVAQL